MEFQCDCDYRKVINTKCFVYISHLRRTFRKTRNSFFSSSLSMNYKWAATMISILQLIFHIGIYRVGEWQANFDVYSTHQHIHAYTRICATSTDVVGGRYFYVCCRNKYHDFGISFFFFWVRKQNMCPSSVHEVQSNTLTVTTNTICNVQCEPSRQTESVQPFVCLCEPINLKPIHNWHFEHLKQYLKWYDDRKVINNTITRSVILVSWPNETLVFSSIFIFLYE